MVKYKKTIKSILSGTLVAFILVLSMGAVTGCGPGTAGYDWHSGEMEIERTPADQ